MDKLRKFFGIALVAAIAISMTACPDGGGNGDDTKNPTITVKSAGNVTSLAKGNTLQFNATPSNITGTPTWSIVETGKNANTTINGSGLLTVDAAETLNSLTIKAAIGTVSGTFTLTLTAAPTNPTITVKPDHDVRSLEKGKTLQFIVELKDITGTPTWSIVETDKHVNTTISTAGLLTVNAAETLNELNIKATIDDVAGTYELTLTAAQPITITAAGGATSLQKGSTLQFTAAGVTGVTWSITDSGKHANTTISNAGLLTVNAAETLNELNIKADTATGLTGTFKLGLTIPLGYDLKFQQNLNNALPKPASVTVTGTATYDDGAKTGQKAIKLSGENYIQLDTEAEPFNYNQSFTVAFWIKVLSNKGSDPPVFSNKNWEAGSNNGFQIMVKNGGILLNSRSPADSDRLNGGADLTVATNTLTGATTANATPSWANSQWVHIAVVYDKTGGTNGQVRYYANGVKTNQNNTNLTQGISGGQRTYIGQSMASGSYGQGVPEGLYNGAAKEYNVEFLMQDFLLVSGAKTDDEIAALVRGED